MNRDIFIALLVAIGGVCFVVWWFFGFNPITFITGGAAETTVYVKDGAYRPAVIQVDAGNPIKLRFIRQDLAACAKTVTFPALNITYTLPVNEPVVVSIPPLERGEYVFNCGMSMYKGKLVVR